MSLGSSLGSRFSETPMSHSLNLWSKVYIHNYMGIWELKGIEGSGPGFSVEALRLHGLRRDRQRRLQRLGHLMWSSTTSPLAYFRVSAAFCRVSDYGLVI